MGLKISNRRYIGGKSRILKNIEECIGRYNLGGFSFADIFGGTGVVADTFYLGGHDVIVNDTLYSNYVAYQTWMSGAEYNEAVIKEYLQAYNAIDATALDSNYFSDIFANKYYALGDAKKIGYIREDLEKNKDKINKQEYYIILTSLLYAADRIANTCGHYESFLNTAPQEQGIKLIEPEINKVKQKSQIYCMDANKLVEKIKADVFYIDPPYNARQYVNFYHVLENLARWEKPTELEGNSMKFKRNNLKSAYSRSKAPEVFEDLITKINAKLIVVSYNNTYNARSGASNNKISIEQMESILRKKGKVDVVGIDFNSFQAGKTDFKDHKEFLYLCEVR